MNKQELIKKYEYMNRNLEMWVPTSEIFLSKNDFERISNGHDLKIRIKNGRGSKINGIILKPEPESKEVEE